MSLKVSVFFLLACGFTVALDPPVWPQHFSQSFVETYSYTKLHTVAAMYYDSKNNWERVDREDGRFEPVCSSVMPNIQTRCTQLVRDDKLYMIYPNQRYCCMCCDAAHGCGVNARDWLKNGTYEGEELLSGESFNKWSITKSSIIVSYYAGKDAHNTPRRINEGNIKIVDFIMNSYSEEQLAESVFQLPSYCTSACPSTTVCGQLRGTQLTTQ